ncbi:MAG TPA: hypothetical protein VK395_22305 [Gemmataceae bacterium]|nr:hypothetical protein [Gemmataceae bacterium]
MSYLVAFTLLLAIALALEVALVIERLQPRCRACGRRLRPGLWDEPAWVCRSCGAKD